MKNLLFLLALPCMALGIAACTPASTDAKTETKEAPKPIVDPVKPADPVQVIKGKVDKIDQEFGQYTKTEVDFIIEEHEVNLIGWSKGEQLKKLTEELLDDHGPLVTHYYFDNDKCVFALHHSELYEQGRVHLTEDRYFLEGKKLLAHWNKHKSVPEGGSMDLSGIPNEEQELDQYDGQVKAQQASEAHQRFQEAAK